MPTDLETKKIQKDRLYELLEIEALNRGIVVQGLKQSINRAKVSMSKEDVADVEKSILEMYPLN